MSQNTPPSLRDQTDAIGRLAKSGVEAMEVLQKVERSRARNLVDRAYAATAGVCALAFLGFEFIGDRLLTPGESTVGKYTALGIAAIVLIISAIDRKINEV